MSNRRNNQFMWNPHNKATVLDCNFIVDATNGNGFGIRSLDKGGRIANVFMNTSAAFTATYNNSVNLTGIASGTATLKVGMPVQGTGIPAGSKIASIVSSSAITISAATTGGATTGSVTYQGITTSGLVNPNPAAGVILVYLQDNYNTYLGGYSGFVSPLSGSTITSGMTKGVPYVIVSLGSSTLAQWQTAGLEVGIVPAVGVAFIAAATSIAGGGAVQASATAGSGITNIEVLGNSALTNSNGGVVIGAGIGMQLILQCFASGTRTAPANNSVVGMNFYMNDSESGV